MTGITKKALVAGMLFGSLTGSLLFLFSAPLPYRGSGLAYFALLGGLVGNLDRVVYGALTAAYLRHRGGPWAGRRNP